MEQEIKFIQEATEYLKSNECDFSKILKESKVWETSDIEKDEDEDFGQETIAAIVEAKLKINDEIIIIKISPYPDKHGNSFIVENQIYKFVQSFLLNKYSPHIVGYLGDYVCNNLKGMDEKAVKKRLELIQKFKKYKLLITIKSLDTTLNNIVQNLTEYELLEILFQFVYTLICFKQYQLVHNDFNLKNVLIGKCKESIQYQYENKYYTLSPKYMIKIFDFNYASIPLFGIERNMNVDKTRNIFATSEDDLSSFILELIRMNELPLVTDIEKENIKNMFGIKDFTKPTLPVEKCLKNLINQMIEIKHPNITIDKNETINCYKLPENKLKIKNWFPVNNQQMELKFVDAKKIDITPEKIIKKMKSKKFVVELLKKQYNYDLFKEAEKLYQNYIDKTKKDANSTLFLICHLLAYPFWHSYSRYTKRYILRHFFNLKNKLDRDYIENYINHVWNFYNNRLPIEMPFI